MNLSELKLKITSFLSNIKPVYLFVIIGVIVILQVVWAYRTLTASNPSINQVPKNTQSSPQKVLNVISLATPRSEYKIGEKIPVAINIISDKSTAGTDLIIKYDPNLLTVVTNSNNTPMIAGTIYDDYPVNKVDAKLGLITVSGITNNVNGIVSRGVFGIVIFQAKAAGVARVFFDFTKGATNDTNIIENQTAKDILEEVSSLDLKIVP